MWPCQENAGNKLQSVSVEWAPRIAEEAEDVEDHESEELEGYERRGLNDEQY